MSATIYQFPAGGRAGLASKRERINAPTNTTVISPAVTACGSAWYHEEAVKDDEDTRKR